MPHLTFRDSQGTEWQVWAVIPGSRQGTNARGGEDRRSPDPVIRYTGQERRAGEDRRKRTPLLSGGLKGGWLTFESVSEKRRLVPIPAGWESGNDAALEEWCRRARPVPRMKLI